GSETLGNGRVRAFGPPLRASRVSSPPSGASSLVVAVAAGSSASMAVAAESSPAAAGSSFLVEAGPPSSRSSLLVRPSIVRLLPSGVRHVPAWGGDASSYTARTRPYVRDRPVSPGESRFPRWIRLGKAK